MPKYQVGDHVCIQGVITKVDADDEQLPYLIDIPSADAGEQWYGAQGVCQHEARPVPTPAPEGETGEQRIERIRAIIAASREAALAAGSGPNDDAATALAILALEAYDDTLTPLVRMLLPGGVTHAAETLTKAVASAAIAYGYLLGRYGAI